MAGKTQIASVHVHARPERYAQDITTRHHVVVCDESVHGGGADAGPWPFELLLASLGACTSITLRMYAERKGWDIGAVSVALKFFREGEGDRIERTLSCAKPLTEEQRERLLEIADKTPVTKTVMRGVAIATTIA